MCSRDAQCRRNEHVYVLYLADVISFLCALSHHKSPIHSASVLPAELYRSIECAQLCIAFVQLDLPVSRGGVEDRKHSCRWYPCEYFLDSWHWIVFALFRSRGLMQMRTVRAKKKCLGFLSTYRYFLSTSVGTSRVLLLVLTVQYD